MSLLDLVLDRPQAEPKWDRPTLTMHGEGEEYSYISPYWQEPVLTEADLFPESVSLLWKPTVQVSKPPATVIQPLPTYRSYTNPDF